MPWVDGKDLRSPHYRLSLWQLSLWRSPHSRVSLKPLPPRQSLRPQNPHLQTLHPQNPHRP